MCLCLNERGMKPSPLGRVRLFSREVSTWWYTRSEGVNQKQCVPHWLGSSGVLQGYRRIEHINHQELRTFYLALTALLPPALILPKLHIIQQAGYRVLLCSNRSSTWDLTIVLGSIRSFPDDLIQNEMELYDYKNSCSSVVRKCILSKG